MTASDETTLTIKLIRAIYRVLKHALGVFESEFRDILINKK